MHYAIYRLNCKYIIFLVDEYHADKFKCDTIIVRMEGTMRSINPTFTNEEFKEIEKIKNNHNMNWHDIVYHAILAYEE